MKAGAVDATTARLTDASGYTGSHKERFDADGKGKGIDGRTDRSVDYRLFCLIKVPAISAYFAFCTRPPFLPLPFRK